jgi:hypothetical protein
VEDPTGSVSRSTNSEPCSIRSVLRSTGSVARPTDLIEILDRCYTSCKIEDAEIDDPAGRAPGGIMISPDERLDNLDSGFRDGCSAMPGPLGLPANRTVGPYRLSSESAIDLSFRLRQPIPVAASRPVSPPPGARGSMLGNQDAIATIAVKDKVAAQSL